MIDVPKPDVFMLPRLNPLVRLFKASDDLEGQPRWSLYNPVSNAYFSISWPEFECLARLHKYDDGKALIDAVNNETALEIDEDDLKALVMFLHGNGLLEGMRPEYEDKQKPLWERLVHNYLFFTLPLFKPQAFLQRTLKYVRPFLSKQFVWFSAALLLFGVFLTLQRFDEFMHTFLDLFSVQGVVISAIVFTGLKIVHEFAHAYVATKYGVKVPHMGAAFIVMYPVLYTETTASWQLASRRKRMEIGLAGVAAELFMAGVFLLLWHILPPGTGKSMAFAVVAISLIGSLFVNLNPLMRFDGYFVLSDALNIENLHARAIALARYHMRKMLFGYPKPAPEMFSSGLHRFMIIFGYMVIIYRFFLFLGIAILVYTVFFKPLGLILMILELYWFIGKPLISELKIWWEERADIFSTRRAKVAIGGAALVILFFAMPVHQRVSVEAVMHAAQERSLYPPSASQILELNVENGQRVQQGTLLARLSSKALEQEYRYAQQQLINLEDQKRRLTSDIEQFKERGVAIQDEIDLARANVGALEKRIERLEIIAPFDGVVRDVVPDMHEGRFVAPSDLLLRIVDDGEAVITAYVGENDFSRLSKGASASFFGFSSFFSKIEAEISLIDPVNLEALARPELASVYGGAVPSVASETALDPLEPTYRIVLKPLINNMNYDADFATVGRVHIEARRQSSLFETLKSFIALILRESGLN